MAEREHVLGPLTPGVPAGPQCCEGKAFPLIWLCQHWIHANAQLAFPTLPPSKISHLRNGTVVGFSTTSSGLSTMDTHWANLLGNMYICIYIICMYVCILFILFFLFHLSGFPDDFEGTTVLQDSRQKLSFCPEF